jgi:hypothetical protein
MQVELITVIYNEEMLLPLFLNHYSWVDKIHVIIDNDTNDSTLEILSRANVQVYDLKFPNMMDADIKQRHIHAVYSLLTCDWAIIVDCDEFIFPFNLKESCRDALSRANGDYIRAFMWPVYRHRTDKDINSVDPVFMQRRHGDKDWSHGFNSAYIKPCIGKPSAKINWYLGCHNIINSSNLKESSETLQGAHWKMADPELSIVRRINNGRNRQSQVNLVSRYQIQDHFITEEQIRNECNLHLDDPILF